MNYFIDMCFLCLIRGKNNKSILSQDNDGIIVEDKLKYIISELVNFKPDIPKNICTDCLKDLNYVCNFKQKCLQNLILLSDYTNKISEQSRVPDYILPNVTEIQHNLIPQNKKGANITDYNNEISQTKSQIQENNVKDKVLLKTEQVDIDDDTDLQYFEDIHTTKNPQENFETKQAEDDKHFQMSVTNNAEECNKIEEIFVNENFVHENIDIKCETLTENTSDVESKSVLQNEESNNADPISTSGFISDSYRPYKCTLCPKTFTYKSKYTRHKLSHSGEKLYNCDLCNKSFIGTSSLKVHQRLHTGEKPFKCDVCEKEFTQTSQLKNHKRVHTGEEPYQCEVCSKAFNIKNNLTKHLRIHTGDKPYKCDVCDKVFSQKCQLTNHKRVHTGEKPYKCDVCDKAFSVKHNLIAHQRTHVSEKGYQCEMCMYKCKTQFQLKTHSLRKHLGEDKPSTSVDSDT